jgi:hypothetical protein
MDEKNNTIFKERMKEKTNKANTKKCCNFAENLQEL